jgi:hypothetical protein
MQIADLRNVPFQKGTNSADADILHSGRLSGATPGDEVGDPVNRSEIFELDIGQIQRQAEHRLNLKQQFDEAHRIENAGFEQVGIGRRYGESQPLGKQIGDVSAECGWQHGSRWV